MRALDRRRPGQVEVVADQHGLPDLEVGRASEPLALVSRANEQPGRGGGSDAVHDGPEPVPLVEVGAPGSAPASATPSDVVRRDGAAMSLGGRREEAGHLGHREAARPASPNASAAGPQPEPRTTTARWRSTPVSSAIRAAACVAARVRVRVGHGAQPKPRPRASVVAPAPGPGPRWPPPGRRSRARRPRRSAGRRRTPRDRCPARELKKTAPITAWPIARPIR